MTPKHAFVNEQRQSVHNRKAGRTGLGPAPTGFFQEASLGEWLPRHCEEQRDEAIQGACSAMDCFAWRLTMTVLGIPCGKSRGQSNARAYPITGMFLTSGDIIPLTGQAPAMVSSRHETPSSRKIPSLVGPPL